MPRSRSSLLATLTGAGLAVGALNLVPASPASASPPESPRLQLLARAWSDTCAGSAGSATPTTYAVPTDGTEVPRTAGVDTTIHSALPPAESTEIRGEVRAVPRITTRGGVPQTVELVVDDELALDADYVATCQARAVQAAQLVVPLQLPRPGWLTLQVDNAGLGEAQARLRTGGSIVADLTTTLPDDRRAVRVLLPAGLHQLTLRGVRGARAADGDLSVSGAGRLRATFAEAGTATGPERGAGRSLVDLPTGRDCAAGSAAIVLRAGPGRAAAVRLLVDGRKVRTVRKVERGRRVVLRNLPATKAVTLRAVVVLQPARKGRTKAASRSYLACR
ncbi:hypothetical protein [Nocardioides sp. SYSU D00038]|uniref:hypothetical protein n=1 Tax=Nocardioides sp. SYSU D00038 TaxID=2812554 RepID=UPI0019683318|nr:hypothetical protein [Nocardioides sp. SYSU D00038]